MQDKSFVYFIDNIPLGKFDLGGVLYHANYFYLYELAREAFLKANNLEYATLVKDGYHLAVVESQQQFLKPIYYGDKVTLTMSASAIGATSFLLSYDLTTKENILIHKASTKHVLVKNENNSFKIAKLSEALLQAISGIAT